jgi:hypothetical protein
MFSSVTSKPGLGRELRRELCRVFAEFFSVQSSKSKYLPACGVPEEKYSLLAYVWAY